MSEETVVSVKHVSKDFKLPHEQANSVKTIFTDMFKSKSKGVETQHALKNVSFDIKKGEFFGIVGRNGSGKSTMLKMLAGIYQPTKGSISTIGKLVPFIELGVGFNPELTGRENVYLNGALLGFSVKEIDAQYDRIVQFAELERFMDQKLKNYSSGMQVRLAFSVATTAKADILLIDEVLAVGDADFQRKCFDYFRKLKKTHTTVIFVTHDMNAVREYCDRAVLIDENVVKDIGDPEAIAQKYSQLFLGKASTKQHTGDDNGRWGTEEAKYEKVKITTTPEMIEIATKIDVAVDLDVLVYGIHFFSSNGTEIIALNNRMIKKPDLTHVKAGDSIDLKWSVQNIFNDGGFYVTLTLVDSTGEVFDWYNEAAGFTIKRELRSTTPIIPPIQVESKIANNSNKRSSHE